MKRELQNSCRSS